MTILYTASKDPDVLGVVCDRCQATLFDTVELGEVLHVRLHAGYGSEWGDGNLVEVDLCDACANAVLSPYARILPSSERLTGQFGVALDRRHRLLRLQSRALRGLLSARPPTLPPSGLRESAVWAHYWFQRGLIPLRLCLRPLRSIWNSLASRWVSEESALRADYWDRLAPTRPSESGAAEESVDDQ